MVPAAHWQNRLMALASIIPGSSTPVLIFDGDCGFCTSAVTWLSRTLPIMPAATPFQWSDLSQYGLNDADAAAKVWFVDGRHRYGGAAAVAAMLRRQPVALLRLLGWLGTVPPWSSLAEVAYRVVARYRYRLPGGTPACRMRPGP